MNFSLKCPVGLRLLLFVLLGLMCSIAAASNPQVPQGGYGTFPGTGYDTPANGQLWDIKNPSGTIIATNSSPNGWSFTSFTNVGGPQMRVGAPSTASILPGYEVRMSTGGSGGLELGRPSLPAYPSLKTSAYFDVISGVPTPPTGLTASGGNAIVNLSWNVSQLATGYNLKRSTNPNGPFSTITPGSESTLNGVVSATDPNVSNGTTYYYVVTATNSFGESGNSNVASATPNGPPLAPTNLTAAAGDTQITLSWTASANTSSYNVKRALVSGGPYSTIATGITTPTYIDRGLTDGTTYFYVVSAVNTIGESPNSNEASATPTASTNPPPAPTGLTASPGDTLVSLAWNGSQGATAYNVYRALSTGGPYTKIASGVTGAAYSDTGVTNGTTYFYVVTATNAYGESGYSNEASATPEPAPPVPPTKLNAYPGNAQVTLTWTGSPTATAYNVKRSTTTGGPYSTIKTGATTTTYVDGGVNNGTTYFYVVTATNPGGESGNSNEVHATPIAARVPLGIVPNPPLGILPDALTLPGWMEDTIPTDASDGPGGGPA